MKYEFNQEIELLTRILSFKDDPEGFVHYAYPWGQPGTPLANFRAPRKWQLAEFVAMAEHLQETRFALENGLPAPIWRSAYSSGRGPGKSAFFGMASHWHMSTHIGAQTIVAANTETQMRLKTFPEFARWFTLAVNAHWFVLESMKITPAEWLALAVSKPQVEGGLGIDAKYWNVAGQTWTEESPESFAGAHNAYGLMVLFDEASGIPAPVWDTTDGFFTDPTLYRFFMAASQMRQNSGRFYDLFHSEKFKDTWRALSMNIEGMEGIDAAWVAEKIKQYGPDSDFVRVEIRGLPPVTAETQFISTEAVRQAQANKLWFDQEEPLIMGVDPAPRGRTVIRFRQGRNARDCVGRDTRIVLNGQDNVQIAATVMRLQDRYRPDATCIDFGLGTGVIDIIKRTHRRHVMEVKFGEAPHNKNGEFAVRAAELWGELRDWLSGGMIDDSPELFRDLTDRGWRWSGREDGKKILEAKEDIWARACYSPDDADALACTFAARPARKSNGAGRTQVADGVSCRDIL